MKIADMKAMRMRELGKKAGRSKISRYGIFVIAGILSATVLLALSFYEPFCKRYADDVYPFIADGLGVFMSVFPFAIGEILMYAAIPGVLCFIISAGILFLCRKDTGLKRICGKYCKAFISVIIFTVIIYELNWFIVLKSPLLGHGKLPDREYTLEDMRSLRNYLVDEINETAEVLLRDEDGNLICSEKDETDREVFYALNRLSDEYERLSGYCAPVKTAGCSQILHSMDIGGYTYPYTMEITCNRYVTDIYYPSLASHEECHHKGYYRENEAVFLGCLSLMKHGKPFIRYSGFITAYSYIDKAYRDSLSGFYTKEEADAVRALDPKLSERVRKDLDLARSKAEKRYEKEKSVPENILNSAKEASDTGWDTQKKILDMDSYDGSVILFLDYFSRHQEKL